jgi:hypothetical protein
MTRARRPEGSIVAWYDRRRAPRRQTKPHTDRVTLCGSDGDVDIFVRNAQGVFVPVTQLGAPEEIQ